MDLDKAEKFLKEKGLDTEKYRIMDVNGGYLPQIPIALWLTEFAEQVSKNESLHLVSDSLLLPKGHKLYECTDCKKTNSMKDNGKVTVGYCRNCKHPLWNDAD
jgi:hypothetical protein